MKKLKNIIDFLKEHTFLILLLCLLSQLALPIFFNGIVIKYALTYILMSLTILVSALIFHSIKSPKLIWIIVSVVLIALVLNWVDYFGEDNRSIQIPRLLIFASIYIYIFVNIFKENRKRDEVTLNTIFGAISGYVIIGFIGAFFSFIIEMFYPNSIGFKIDPVDFQDHLYYNFVTITTLGYGDISPITEQGQTHSILMVIWGQLYLTITIAMIVGKYLSNSSKKTKIS